jgi:hypothetical protein
MINRGPVDVVVLAAGAPSFDGSIFAELGQQAAGGTIRVLDALLLVKDAEGNRARYDLEDFPSDMKEAVGFIETGTRGLFDSEDAETLFEGMVPGSAVCTLAIEHVWAVKLVNVMRDAGVELALNFRVPAPIVDEAFASLEQKS